MKDKIKIFLLTLFGITVITTGILFADNASNWTSQQILNWLFGGNTTQTGTSGLYNASDSSVSVRLKSVDTVFTVNTEQTPDTATWLFTQTTNVLTPYTRDTLDFTAHYNYKFKVSVSPGGLLRCRWLGDTDSTTIAANGSLTFDYLNISTHTKLLVWDPSGNVTYNGASQGK